MFIRNRKNYSNLIKENSISLFFSGKPISKTADSYYRFAVCHNFYYLTGINQDNVILLLIKTQEELKEYLFLEQPDPIKALWDGSSLSFTKASEISGVPVENIMDISSFNNFFNLINDLSRRNTLGDFDKIYLDITRNNFDDQLKEAELFIKNILPKYPHLHVLRSSRFINSLRMRKDKFEIDKIKQSIKITKDALTNVYQKLPTLKSEQEVYAEFMYILNKNGAIEGFDSIIASGTNATILHYVDNNMEISNDSLVLLDVGARYNFYNADISRTYPVNGKFNEQQRSLYQAVLNVNKEVIEWLKPGITLKEFNEYGKKLLTEEAKKIGLIKNDDEITKYYYHSLGHYLGLDVHDVGDNSPIPVGAVITVEPGLYVKEWNMGVRIEDDILITETGNINLSEDIIKEIADIEAAMKLK